MSCNFQAGVASGTSLLCAFSLSCVMACLTTFHAACCALILGLIFFIGMGKVDRKFFETWLTANFFLIFIWAIVPWSAPGDALFQWGSLKISQEGVNLCLLVSIKANAIILVFSGIMQGMTPMKLGLALAQLHFSQKLALVLVFAAQQVDNLKQEWTTLREAAKLKSFKANTSFRTWKVIAAMLAILLLKASERADILHEALLLRAFSGKFPICCPYSPGKRDFGLFLATLISICLLLFLDFYGFTLR